MKRRTALFAAVILAAHPVLAQDAPEPGDHYAAEASENLVQAQANFTEYNARMAAVLAKDSMTANDMEEIHQMTYTLEAALARIIEEATALAALLERVHHASEMAREPLLRPLATDYLTIAKHIVP